MCPYSLSGLVERLAHGDGEALGLLFDQIEVLVRAEVDQCAAASAEAEREEIVRRVFTRIWRCAPSYDADTEPVLSWIERLVLAECGVLATA